MDTRDLAEDAVTAASKATGLRPDQIARAVAEYRAAASDLHVEPEWQAQTHFCMSDSAWHSYIDPAENTKVVKFVWLHKNRDGWDYTTVYQFNRQEFESFGEARAVELVANTKFRPHVVRA